MTLIILRKQKLKMIHPVNAKSRALLRNCDSQTHFLSSVDQGRLQEYHFISTPLLLTAFSHIN